jgi:acyl-coenzyme A thioesterase PaaI-like protein
MRFDPDESGTVCGHFNGDMRLQGYQGILHGGVLAALLDSAMTHCLFHRGVRAVTGDLRVRFVQPVSCEATLSIRAHLQSATSPLYYLRAEVLEGERVMAWGEATFVERALDGPRSLPER